LGSGAGDAWVGGRSRRYSSRWRQERESTPNASDEGRVTKRGGEMSEHRFMKGKEHTEKSKTNKKCGAIRGGVNI